MLIESGNADSSDPAAASLSSLYPLTVVWMKQPMNKKFAFAFAALLCIASQGYARHPFVYDPISEAPSVLVNADDSAAPVAVDQAAPVAADQAVTAEPESATAVIGSDAFPMPSEGAMVKSEPVMVTESAPVYRSRTYRKSSNGVVSELIQLERRKNAWIRRNIFGR